MKPIVNTDEFVGKQVGRDLPADYDRLVGSSKSLMPRLPIPKGVFRFRSHEEADSWMEEHILRRALIKARARQNEAT